MTGPSRLLTAEEAADRLGCQYLSVLRLAATGRLAAVPDPGGEGWLVPESSLAAFAASVGRQLRPAAAS